MALRTRIRHFTKLSICLLTIITIGACSQRPVQPPASPNKPKDAEPKEVSSPTLNLSLDRAYTQSHNRLGTLVSSKHHIFHLQSKLDPVKEPLFTAQNHALAVVETYWEAAILHQALQQLWLMQQHIKPVTTPNNTNSNLATPVSFTQLKQYNSLLQTQHSLSKHQSKVQSTLDGMINSHSSKFSFNHLPLTLVRQRLPHPDSLLIDQFSKQLLKHHYETTYASLRSQFPALQTLKESQLYHDPILGKYVWGSIDQQLQLQASQSGTLPNPAFFNQMRLTQLQLALINYHYNFQKMTHTKRQYQTAQSLYHLSPLETHVRGIESMALKLLHLQSTLDSIQAYTQLLASSHLPPSSWQHPLVDLNLTSTDRHLLSSIVDLAPAYGPETSKEASQGTIMETEKTTQIITHKALAQHLSALPLTTPLQSAALPYLWQINISPHTTTSETQSLLADEQELIFQLQTRPQQNLTARGIGQDQARALCARLKSKTTECWLVPSER